MTRLAKWWRSNRPKWWRGKPPAMDAAPAQSREVREITDGALRELMELVKDHQGKRELTSIPTAPYADPFKPAPVPSWAKDAVPQMAMDYTIDGATGLGYGSEIGWNTGIGWLGFPFLAELSQRPEYRTAFETRAQEMTRKWIEFGYTGEGGTAGPEAPGAKKIAELTKAMDDHKLRDHFRMVVEHDGEFGGAHLFIDVNESFDKPDELRTPLLMKPAKIPKGGKLAFRVVEPTWVYPLVYNSNNPLSPDYFKPQTWSVSGLTVHRSRLLTFVAREVPDILKPAYSFRGLSLSQLQLPYVNNWLRTRQSVSDIIHSFTVFVLKTVMAQVLDVGGMKSLMARVAAFNLFRDNKGTFTLDRETEDFENVSAPLAGLHELQAQSQEQMAAVVKTPLVKLLGIQPSGLNASSDGEIRVYYDTTHAEQENLLREHLGTCLNVLMLNLWGAIDENITFSFVSLWELDEAAEASVQKTKTDTDVENMNAGAISPEEVRERLARDPKSQYHGLDLSGPPPEIEEEDDASIEADPARTAEPRSQERSGV